MAETPPADAGDPGSVPGLGGIPRALGQLSPWAMTTEDPVPRVCALPQEKPLK